MRKRLVFALVWGANGCFLPKCTKRAIEVVHLILNWLPYGMVPIIGWMSQGLTC